jgi:hypothetical protein
VSSLFRPLHRIAVPGDALLERRDLLVGLGEGVAFVDGQSSHLRCTLPSIVLDHLGTASQGDGRAWPAFAGCPIGRDRKLGVLDARQVFSRLLKKGRLPLTLNCESYANKGMAGGIDARFGYADG